MILPISYLVVFQYFSVPTWQPARVYVPAIKLADSCVYHVVFLVSCVAYIVKQILTLGVFQTILRKLIDASLWHNSLSRKKDLPAILRTCLRPWRPLKGFLPSRLGDTSSPVVFSNLYAPGYRTGHIHDPWSIFGQSASSCPYKWLFLSACPPACLPVIVSL